MSLTRPRLSSRLAARASGARQLAVAKPGHAAKVAVQARAELKTETVRVSRAPPLAGSPDCRRRRVPGAVSGLLLTTLPPVLERAQAIETVKTAGIAATLSAAATGALVPEQADAMTQVRARVAFHSSISTISTRTAARMPAPAAGQLIRICSVVSRTLE